MEVIIRNQQSLRSFLFMHLQFIATAVEFAIWQKNPYGGLFVYFLLISIAIILGRHGE